MQNETVDDNYKKGFEQGYWLQRDNRPDLVKDAMRASTLHGGYGSAMKAGKDEAVREQLRSRMTEKEKGRENAQGQDWD